MSTLFNTSEAEQRATLLGNERADDENDEDTIYHDASRLTDENHRNHREASVSLLFLLILTSGVAG